MAEGLVLRGGAYWVPFRHMTGAWDQWLKAWSWCVTQLRGEVDLTLEDIFFRFDDDGWKTNLR